MTEDQKRIAIAEARGWVWYRIPKLPSETREHRALFHPSMHEYEGQSEQWKVRADGTERVCNMEYMEREGYVPKITLDEMHQAVLTLNRENQLRWLGELILITKKKGDYAELRVALATSDERAEAFLKVIGKWVE